MENVPRRGRRPKAARKTGFNLSLDALDVLEQLAAKLNHAQTRVIEDVLLAAGEQQGIHPRPRVES